jgi:hypothetical protein
LSAETISTPNSRFKIGSIILLLIAVFNLYALLVVLIPFRGLEKWAWVTTWILPAGLALPAYLDHEIAFLYIAVAAMCVLGLLLTLRDSSRKVDYKTLWLQKI